MDLPEMIIGIILAVLLIVVIYIFGLILFSPAIYEVKNITITDKWHDNHESTYYIKSDDELYRVPNTLYPQFIVNNSYTVSLKYGIGNSSTIDKILTYK